MLLARWRTRRRALLWLLLVPVLPLLVVSGATSYEYLAGSVRVPGFPAGARSVREHHNLDREYRVLGGVRSERILPWTLLVARTRRYTLATLVDWFGPVPGSYQGPYPDRETAFASARAARVFATPEALTQPLLVGGRSILLSAQDLQRVFEWSPSTQAEGSVLALHLFEGTCLLIGFSSGDSYHVELVDTAGFGWFARYVFPSEQTASSE
jgi:hypothetical protein